MTIHFRGKCEIAADIICFPPCETHWNKTQPNLIMRGMASEVKIVNNIATIYR